MNNERRKSKRFKVPDTEFMVFHKSSHFAGWIKDISLSGLSFESSSSIDFNSGLPEIGIFAYRYDRFCLPKLPIKICYNVLPKDETYSFSGIPTRLCGVVFDDLEKSDKEKIAYLLNTYTTNDRYARLPDTENKVQRAY